MHLSLLYVNTKNYHHLCSLIHIGISIIFRLCKIAGVEQKIAVTKDSEGSSRAICRLTWVSYGIQPDQPRGYRTNVPVTLKFQGYRPLEFKFQCKFYSAEEEIHTKLGEAVNYTYLSCTAGRGDFFSTVDIFKYISHD